MHCSLPLRGFSCLAAVLLAVGCGAYRKQNSDDRFIPTEETAQEALSDALTAWQRGEPLGRVESVRLPVYVVDSFRRAGQRLHDYTILGPVPGETPRCYAVRLHLENPQEEKRARFVVLGLDPLWVMTHEDLEMTNHWEHRMDADKPQASSPGPK
jgi:hypothetical protein